MEDRAGQYFLAEIGVVITNNYTYDFGVLPLLVLLLGFAPLSAAPVPVRHTEGAIHTYLMLHTISDSLLAQGDVVFTVRGDTVEKRMLLTFQDSTKFEETVEFTWKDVYTLHNYHLVHQGPAFPEDLEVSLHRNGGKYRVWIKNHKDGSEKVLQGALDLPPDVYNGLIPDVTRDLAPGKGETVRYIAFTPEPRMIKLGLIPDGEGVAQIGDSAKTATRYVIRAKFGFFMKLLVKLLGGIPPDYYMWVVPEEVPLFVGFEGQLYMDGPMWRISLANTPWPK
jgi:hypothetical protein